jgi:exonuclease III
MSYNTGGCGKKVEAIIHLIKKESPDILALNEVCSSIINKIPQQLDMPHYAISTPVSKLNNTGLFSRYKLNNIKKFLSFTNSGVNANIYTPLGEVSVGALHLAPNTEQTRLAELTKVINWQSGHKNKVILGDLNAISPLDKVFIKIKGRMVVVKAEYEVINLLAQNNYTDASKRHLG